MFLDIEVRHSFLELILLKSTEIVISFSKLWKSHLVIQFSFHENDLDLCYNTYALAGSDHNPPQPP